MNDNFGLHPRPKFGVGDDAEDELLQFQELFQRSNMKPAAQVIREPKTKRQQSTEDEQTKKKTTPIDLTETTVMRPVIVERDVRSVPIQLPNPTANAFPEAKFRGDEDFDKITLPNVKKASLFAKQMYRDGKLKTCRDLEETKVTSDKQNLPRSHLLTGIGLGEVTGEREMKRIHDENTDRLKSMDEKEILAEKEKLLKTLDPKLISFIRQRHKKSNETVPIRESMETEKSETKMTSTENALPIEIDSRWLHMDKVEHEKLEWMKDLPKPSAQRTTDDSNSDGVPARFDFKGNLIARDADVPVTAALYHHGEEPDAAGYTLEELFHLSRSTILQQRVIALQTLANIIRQAHTGVYDLELQLPLIPKLIEAGLVFLVRWAMDEQVEVIFMIALECLASLIAPKTDEKILEETFHWPCGYLQPMLTPPEIDLGEKKNESDLNDIEILEQDLIKCLFRMNLLKRILYLFDRMRLSPSIVVVNSVKNSFFILIRMARHSLSCANQIFEEKQLMDFIIRQFIPESAVPSDDGILYGQLLPEALKLCRVLASHGTNLAASLIERYEFQNRLRNHLVAAVNTPSSLATHQSLCELLRLWRIFILQGHTTNDFGSLIPTVVLPLFRICIQQMPNEMIGRILVQLISLIDSLIITVTKFIARHRKTSELTPNVINWSHLDGLFDVILTIGKQTLIETNEKIDLIGIRTSCFSSLASFLIGQQILNVNLLDLPGKVQRISSDFFEPILKLESTKKLVENVSFETAAPPTNSSRNLPTLTQKSISPFGFLTSILRLTNIFYRIDKTLAEKRRFINKLMVKKNSEVLVYVKKMLNKFTSSSISRRSGWFEHFEHLFLFEFVQMIYQEKVENDFPSIYFELLISMLPFLHKNSHFLAEEILKILFFDTSFWKKPTEVEFADLSLISNESLCLASNQTISTCSASRTILYERAVEHLPSLFTYYKNLLHVNRSSTDFSLHDVHFGYFFQSEEFLRLSIHFVDSLIDSTWPYGVLSALYANVLTVANVEQKLELVLNTLRFVYILEMKNSFILSKQLTTTTRFSMIAGIYLLGSDLFLEANVADYLVAFLNCFREKELLQKLQTKSQIQSLMKFFDFFRLLIDQFDASSFGDVLFSNFILVPLQQNYDVALRKYVWIENPTVLKSLRLKPDQLLFSLEHFFLPVENDVEMIRQYSQLVFTGFLTKSTQLFLYTIAIHHLNAFLFDQTRSENFNLQKNLLKSFKDETLKNDLINYKTFSRDGPVMFPTLPLIRVNWLEKISS